MFQTLKNIIICRWSAVDVEKQENGEFIVICIKDLREIYIWHQVAVYCYMPSRSSHFCVPFWMLYQLLVRKCDISQFIFNFQALVNSVPPICLVKREQ